MAQDIDELREYWGHERIVVIGHSVRCDTRADLRGVVPGPCRGVVYLGGVGIGDWRTPYYEELARRMTPAQRDRLERAAAGAPELADEEIEFRVLSWFTDHADQSMAMDLGAGGGVGRPADQLRRQPGARTPRPTSWTDDHLAGLAAYASPMPVAFIHGDGDPRPLSAVRELAAHIPHHTFHLIPGAGHSPWREQPEQLRAVLRGVVSGEEGA